MSIKLLLSPLQGFTDFRFRNSINKLFNGLDTYYAPYIRLQNNMEIKKSYKRDLKPDNNSVSQLIPQVMTNSAQEFLFIADYVKDLGYQELNWNLGCPYPMVTKRGLGCGLIKDVAKIDEILRNVFQETDIQISLKLRLGYDNSNEILDLLPVLEKYSIKYIIIHPRIGRQLYKGEVDLDAFKRCIDNTGHIVHYNGDIDTVARFRELRDRFASVNSWALGRGIIANPFLAEMIKNDSDDLPCDWIDRFSDFHDELFSYYNEDLSGDTHIVLKMKGFWEYFCHIFSNPHKVFKAIKKAKSIAAYHQAVRDNLEGEKN